MKKLYSLLLGLGMTAMGIAQTPIITMIADGDCTGGTPKVLEIYAQGAVDFTQYTLQKQVNANSTWGSDLDLTDLGTVTDAFVYVYYDGNKDNFGTEFPSATTSIESATVNVNGDDKLRIIKTSDSSVIDVYGTGGDGTGQSWEYKDGYAKRNNNAQPSATFNETEWSFHKGALNNEGTCQSGTTFEAVMGGIGTYTTTILGVNDVDITKSISFIKNTIVKEEINFATKSEVKVFDMNGNLIKTAFVSENKALNMSDLPKGMYIVTGLVNGQKVAEKVMKQ
ncbi:MAG: hypothetical protein CSA38_00540 [Flavobacteriales bacterium]|nr:MAG: hypothetical protein CSA38_00540 [Flavobacteriales bacterium]